MTYDWTTANIPSQSGKRILITGGNSGIGYYTALELARHGATVILACRDRTRGEAAFQQLRAEAPSAPPAELAIVNLASLDSVHQLAETQLAKGLPLDALINNAGVFCPPRRLETLDGFELQFGTNVLSHFALTCRLLPLLEMNPAARIVTLSSIAHLRGRIYFDDLQSQRRYGAMRAYEQSKLADLIFAFELERRLRARNSTAISLACHPGVAESKLFKIGSSQGLAAHAEAVVQSFLASFFNSGPEGALPTLYAATSPDAQPAGYYGPQGFREMRGGDVGPAKIAKPAQDPITAQRLWQTCADLTGVDLS